MEVFTRPFFQKYLSFSIQIFNTQYKDTRDYKHHTKWNEYIALLREANCYAVFICTGMCIGNVSKSYFDVVVSEDEYYEDKEKIQERYTVAECIFLAD